MLCLLSLVDVEVDGVGDTLSPTDAVVYFLLAEPFVPFDLVAAGYAYVRGKSLMFDVLQFASVCMFLSKW